MPGSLKRIRGKAEAFCRFIVVGASIAGLASAYALRNAGHDVVVLEQSDGKWRSRGGLCSTPNISKIFDAWGYGAELAKIGVLCESLVFLTGDSGKKLSSLDLCDGLTADLQGRFYFVQHADMYNLLFGMASKAGVVFRFNTRVRSVDAENGCVLLESENVLKADVIVGADGRGGVVSLAFERPPAHANRTMFFTAVIPTDAIRKDTEIAHLAESSSWSFWLGDGCSAHGLLHAGRSYTLTIVAPSDSFRFAFGEGWKTRCSAKDIGIDLSQFDHKIAKLLEMAEFIIPVQHTPHELRDSYVHDSGKVVLVGDAANPGVGLPGGSSSISLAIEDGATLGNLFSRQKGHSQTGFFLNAFEEIRQPRCEQLLGLTTRKREFLCLEGRSHPATGQASYQCSWSEEEEAVALQLWGDYVAEFAHDANEQVDEWWTHWGNFANRGTECRSTSGE